MVTLALFPTKEEFRDRVSSRKTRRNEEDVPISQRTVTAYCLDYSVLLEQIQEADGSDEIRTKIIDFLEDSSLKPSTKRRRTVTVRTAIQLFPELAKCNDLETIVNDASKNNKLVCSKSEFEHYVSLEKVSELENYILRNSHDFTKYRTLTEIAFSYHCVMHPRDVQKVKEVELNAKNNLIIVQGKEYKIPSRNLEFVGRYLGNIDSENIFWQTRDGYPIDESQMRKHLRTFVKNKCTQTGQILPPINRRTLFYSGIIRKIVSKEVPVENIAQFWNGYHVESEVTMPIIRTINGLLREPLA